MGASYTWNNADADWTDPVQWTPNGVPGMGDTVFVNGGVVNLNSDVSVAGDTQSGNSTITGSGILTITSTLTWNKGTQSGTGKTLIAVGATASLDTTDSKFLSVRVFENQGTVNWIDGALYVNGYTADVTAIDNKAGGDFNLTGSTERSLAFWAGGYPRFKNAGTLTHSGTAPYNFDIPTDNTGTVSVTVGTLRFRNGGNHTGRFVTASGTIFDFRGGVHSLDDGATIEGAGVNRLGNGTVNTTGTGSGAEIKTGATFRHDSSGTLGGSGKLTVNGLYDWRQGVIQGAGDFLVNGALKLDTTTSVRTNGRKITIAGSAEWLSGPVQVSGFVADAVAFDVQTGANFNITATAYVTMSLWSGSYPRFKNEGTVTKSPGANTANVDIPFDNLNQVNANAGALQLSRGGSSTGSFVSAAGASLRFAGGTHSLGDGVTLEGAGTLLFSGGRVDSTGSGSGVEVKAGAVFTHGTFGAVGGSGKWTINGTYGWNQGTIDGSGGFVVNGSLLMGTSNTKTLNGRTVSIAGSATWSDGTINLGAFTTGELAIDVQVGASFGITGTAAQTIQLYTGQLPVFKNQGTLTKSTGTAAATFSVTFNNLDQLNVNAGTLKLASGGESAGAFASAGGATLQFTGGTHLLGDGTTFEGAGGIQITGGRVNSTGTTTGVEVKAGAVFRHRSSGYVGGSGKWTINGGYRWDQGTLDGSGDFLVNGLLTMTTAGAKTLKVRTISVANESVWEEGTVNFYNFTAGDVAFDVRSGATFDVTGAVDQVMQTVSGPAPLFKNQGTFTKAPGTAITTIAAPFDSSGLVDVDTGTLKLTGGGTSACVFDVAAAASLWFDGGTHALGEGTQLDGAGTIRISSGRVNSTGSTTGVEVTTGTTFRHNSNSSVGGSGKWTINGTYAWSRGTIDGSGPFLVNNALTLTSANTKTLWGRTVTVSGTVTWSEGAVHFYNFTLGASAFDILAGAEFNVTGTVDQTMQHISGEVPVFKNLGTVSKTMAGGIASFTVPFNNLNQLDVAAGTCKSNSGGASSGVFNVAAAAALEFAGGTHALDDGTTLEGAGTIRISGGRVNSVGSGAGVEVKAGATFKQNSNNPVGGSGDWTINGTYRWSHGTIDGSGGFLVNGNLIIDTANARSLRGRKLTLAGTTSWEGGTIYLYDFTAGATAFENQSGKTFNIPATSNVSIQHISGGVPVFVNAGTVNKTVTGVTATILTTFNHTGVASVSGGELTLSGGGTHTAGYSLASGTTLNLSGTHNLGDDTVFSGAGAVVMTGNVNTTGTNTGTTVQAGIVFNHNSSALNGAGKLTVAGVYKWRSGAIAGSGLFRIDGSLSIETTANHALSGRTIVNAGTIDWPAGNVSTDVYAVDAIVVDNLSGAVFNVAATGATFYRAGGNLPVLRNQGTLNKVSGTGISHVNVIVESSHIINVDGDTLNLGGGGRQSGVVNLAAGSVMNLAGTHELDDGATLSGSGTVGMNGNVNTIGTGSGAIIGAGVVYEQNGSTLNGAGKLAIDGTYRWKAGTIAGSGGFLVNGSMTVQGGSTKTLAGRKIVNDGTIDWTAGNVASVSFAAGDVAIENKAGADFNAAAAASMYRAANDVPTFQNLGAFTRNSGAATATVAWAFETLGTVSAQAGTLSFTAGYTQSGGVLNLDGGNVSSSQTMMLDGGSLTGAGTITGNVANSATVAPGGSAGAGKLTVAGNYVQNSGGVLNIEIGGTAGGTEFDQLAITGSGKTATLNGTLNVSLINGFGPAAGNTFAIATFPSGSGEFATATGLNQGLQGTFTPAYNAADVTLSASGPASTDLGDAPDTGVGTGPGNYQTLLVDSGARHGSNGPTLGADRDNETDGQPTVDSDGDDLTGSDDEDGLTFPPLLVGTAVNVTVNVQNAPSGAKLDAWIDFNQSGVWGDVPNEQVAANVAVVNGDNALNLSIPVGAALGVTHARFRLSSAGGLNPTGDAIDGEVEDAAVLIRPTGGLTIINEVDPDSIGAETQEFIELYDGGVGNTPLDGLVVVAYDGADDQSYNLGGKVNAIDLDGYSTDADGYFVIGNPGAPNVDLTFGNNTLQHGSGSVSDAVALYVGDGTDFPNDTPLTTRALLDAVVFSLGGTVDSGLLPLLNAGQSQINENTGGGSGVNSIQRVPNGQGGERNANNHQLLPPTPGAINSVFEIAATAADKAEGASGLNGFTFTVTRRGDVTGAASVTFTSGGSGLTPAVAGDFDGSVFASGTLLFNAADTSKGITIDVTGDAVVEPNDEFTVTLSAPVNAVVTTGAAIGTIRNDDMGLPTPVVDLAAFAQDVTIFGGRASDSMRASGVRMTGDFNGDGKTDLALAVPAGDGPTDARGSAGDVAIYYGGSSFGNDGVKDLAGVEGPAPDVLISGARGSDTLSADGAVAVGDFNGDGIDDLVIGAELADGPSDGRGNAGDVVIIFGSGSLPATIDLATGGEATTIHGATANDYLTDTGSLTVGDFNGDGRDDVAMASWRADGPGNLRTDAGEVYVVFGQTSYPAAIDLGNDEADITIFGGTGVSTGDHLGENCGLLAADLNGDGRDDLVLAAPYADGLSNGKSNSGEAFVMLGRASFPANLNIDLDPDGMSQEIDVRILGADAADYLGLGGSMTSGDVNGDGVADLVIGARDGDPPSRTQGGEVYVIYGTASLPSQIDLSAGDQDVILLGGNAYDYLGRGGAMAVGDLNGDGIGDIVVGAGDADGPSNARGQAGEAYVVFGSATLPASIDMANGDQDVTVYGRRSNDFLSRSHNVDIADLNGDGYGDVVLSAYTADGPMNGRGSGGETYVIYGGSGMSSVVDLANDEDDIRIEGADVNDQLQSSGLPQVADLNADGIDDLVLSALGGDGPNNSRGAAGEVYVIFGYASGTPYDFGDAPDTAMGTGTGNYQTTLSDDGARHALGSGLVMGNSAEADPDGLPNPLATGDDESDGNDDEDGVTFTALRQANAATATVTVSGGPGKLDAWID